MSLACALCARSAPNAFPVPRFDAHICLPCSVRLGRALVTQPEALAVVWPALREDEDDDDPEPRVRLADGRSVELRDYTAELKSELTLDKRMELAQTLGEIGLPREQALDCGHVLAAEPPEPLAARAVALLFAQPMMSNDPLSKLREVLYPG